MANITMNANYRSIALQRVYDFDAENPKTYLDNGTYTPGVKISFQANGVNLRSKKLVFQEVNTEEMLYIYGDDLYSYFVISPGQIYYDSNKEPSSSTLKNGSTYKCWVEISPDISGATIVIKSDVQQISCYQNPEILLTVSDNHNGNGYVEFTYTQPVQQKQLYEYRCLVQEGILDENTSVQEYGSFLDTGWVYAYSSTVYGQSSDGTPLAMASAKYELSGLADGGTYRCIVLTRANNQNGIMSSSASLVTVVIAKSRPSTDIELSKSDTTDGTILVSADIKKIVGDFVSSTGEDVENLYLAGGGIDLSSVGNSVVFAENISFGTALYKEPYSSAGEPSFIIDLQNPSLEVPLLEMGLNLQSSASGTPGENIGILYCKKKGFNTSLPTNGYSYNENAEIDLTQKETFYRSFEKTEISLQSSSDYCFVMELRDGMTHTAISNTLSYNSDDDFAAAKIRVKITFTKEPNGVRLGAENITG